ncbi:hypothetical protein ZQ34_005019 [Salmonella enterica subsp. salamae]|nr:hypothetical protein [Salmonella enterica subsp. salamae]EEI9684680.1 hypothetical protein [Salmonella enterica]HED0312008.1 hypothetical protein [Salmonella enterica subsp. enterica serovar Newport]EDV1506958.1 hypothetical protein [Salmonella enterica subsp. salamae]EKT4206787.1 hypothetical protein [Salmonella enterica]
MNKVTDEHGNKDDIDWDEGQQGTITNGYMAGSPMYRNQKIKISESLLMQLIILS